MDKDLALYFEIDGAAEDENGNPDCAGGKMKFNGCRVKMDYKTLCEKVNPDELAEDLGFAPGSLHFITPEEFAEKYGDEED